MPEARRLILAILFCVIVTVQVRWSASTIGRLLQPPHNPELINAVNSSLVLQGDEGKKIFGAAQSKNRIVAFAGHPVAQHAELYRLLQSAPLGQTTLTLARGSERVVVPYQVKSLTDESDNLWGGALIIVLNILMPTLCILLGFFVAWQRPAEFSAWMLLVTLLGWSQMVHSNFWLHWGWGDGWRTAAFFLQNSATALWPAAWLWFCVDFPESPPPALPSSPSPLFRCGGPHPRRHRRLPGGVVRHSSRRTRVAAPPRPPAQRDLRAAQLRPPLFELRRPLPPLL